MRLTSFGVEHFRPFRQRVVLENLGRVNLIAVANNVGKSALLIPLRRLSFARSHDWQDVFGPQDLSHPEAAPQFSFGVELAPSEFDRFRYNLNRPPGERFVLWSQHGGKSGNRWTFGLDERPTGGTGDERMAWDLAERIVCVPAARTTRFELTGRSIPTEERSYSGESLFTDVVQAMLDRHEYVAPLEEFASAVLEQRVEVKATVRPPTLRVALDGDGPRFIEQLGHGVTQTLVIAAAATHKPDPILLLEEPELGLHPRVQRRLVNVLAHIKDATTFITTHSNHILDSDATDVRRYHVTADGAGKREVRDLDAADSRLIHDLGARPSSVLITNAVVWVEGPSDAIYLRAWLNAFGFDDLVEHVDYEFVPYGGALLRHSGQNLNRTPRSTHPNWYLVGDSDAADPVSGERNRYLSELRLRVGAGRIWTTHGRCIESYLTDGEICATLETVAPRNRVRNAAYEPLEARLVGLRCSTSIGKVALAAAVTGRAKRWRDRQGLAREVRRLGKFLRAAKDGVLLASDEKPARRTKKPPRSSTSLERSRR